MEFNESTIDKLADLLMIGLTPEENKMILDEFAIIDKNIDKINNIKGIENIKPMTHCLDDFKCELREDIAENSPSIDDLLANCKKVDGREVEVPKVVE
ncbi:MAG: Asp-tRNA(Asn)/Glu-tRNA(Gln) amidotransferase subunit GatC [Bacilli bacterium]|nr:Asp-tRNA(Asn)/Glu-tRNA(Gln) amidotransferase subunit GatC [Bacilli bacterium]